MQRLVDDEYDNHNRTSFSNQITFRLSNCSSRKVAYFSLVIGIPILLIVIICATVSTKADNEIKPAFLQQNPTHQEKKSLELVFLIDRSSQKVLKEMPRLINLTEGLAEEFQGAKFGISLYADFICSDWHGPDSAHCKYSRVEGGYPVHTDQEGCYTFYKELSKDIPSLKHSVDQGNIQFYPSGWYESGIAGLMMTATDKKVGWTGDSRKVIIVVTDDGTSDWPKKFGGQDPPKGDGTDTCQTMQNPTAEFTGDILQRQDISLFLLLATGGSEVNTFDHWTQMMEKMKVKYDMAYMLYPNSVILQQIKTFLR